MKLRVIRPKREDSRYATGYAPEKYGITMPDDIGKLFSGTFFKIERNGHIITLTSGCVKTYTDQQVENYKYEDAIIQ